MNAYPEEYDRRIREPEIVDRVAREMGISLVKGLDEVIDVGDATENANRVAGFMETHDRREWILPLAAKSGLKWSTAPVPDHPEDRVGFALSVGFGNGSPLPQPSGQWDVYVNDLPAVSVRVVKHSQLWRSHDCSCAFAANRVEAAEPYGSFTLSSVIRDESFAAFGPAVIVVPADRLQPGQSASIRVEPRSAVDSTRWFQLAMAPALIQGSDIYRSMDILNGGHRRRASGLNVYFGDIHTHSGDVCGEQANEGCGWATREENYSYARGPGGLDVYALTDHEWQVDPEAITEYLELAEEHNENGRLVCLPAFEHTNLLYGHRNIYFSGPGGTVVNATQPWGRPTMDPEKSTHPRELFSALDELHVPYLSVPHHPSATSHPFDWRHYDPAHDRLVEVYSCWGASEYYGNIPRGVSDRYRQLTVRDGLERGCHVGMIASSDGHDGHPGNAQSPMVKHHHLFHHCGSGWVGILSEKLERRSIFDALYARRCYGTTGVPIGLEFEVDGRPMGSVLHPREDELPVLRVSCQGTNGLDHIRIVRDGKVIHTRRLHGEWNCEVEWVDESYDPSTSSYYYVRIVQVDHESAWSSPIWIG